MAERAALELQLRRSFIQIERMLNPELDVLLYDQAALERFETVGSEEVETADLSPEMRSAIQEKVREAVQEHLTDDEVWFERFVFWLHQYWTARDGLQALGVDPDKVLLGI